MSFFNTKEIDAPILFQEQDSSSDTENEQIKSSSNKITPSDMKRRNAEDYLEYDTKIKEFLKIIENFDKDSLFPI